MYAGTASNCSEITSTGRPGSPRRWLAGLTLVTSLVACESTPTAADGGEACSALVDTALEALIEARDNAGDLTRADFDRISDQSAEVMEPYFETQAVIQARARILNCDNEQLAAEFEHRVSELDTRSVGGAAILLEAYGFLNPFEDIE
jgi:hypothetical protein